MQVQNDEKKVKSEVARGMQVTENEMYKIKVKKSIDTKVMMNKLKIQENVEKHPSYFHWA